jgi:hypothetical protein
VVDYLCDDGFYPTNNRTCSLMSGLVPPMSGCVNGIVGTVSGYVKKSVSVCVGGSMLEIPLAGVACSTGSVVAVSGMTWLVYLLVFFMAVSVATWFIAKKNNRFGAIRLRDSFDDSMTMRVTTVVARIGEWVVELAETVLGSLSRGREWIRDRISRARGYEPVGGNVGLENLQSGGDGLWDDDV